MRCIGWSLLSFREYFCTSEDIRIRSVEDDEMLTIDGQRVVVVSGVTDERVPRVPSWRDVGHPVVLLEAVAVEVLPDVRSVIPSAV